MSTRALQFDILIGGYINDSTGVALEGGTVEFYASGTSTAKNVWTEPEKTNAYTTYSLSTIGAALLYGDGNYKVIIKDAAGTIVDTHDPIRVRHPNYNVESVTNATYNMSTDDDFLRCDTTSNAITINMVAAASMEYPLVVQRYAGANSITIDPNGTETINGSSTLTISFDSSVQIVSDGSNLFTIDVRSAFSDEDGDTYITVEESTDEDYIRMYTGGTERFTINDSGNVGIGDITPDYKLDIEGTLNATGNTTLGGTLDITGVTTASEGITVTDGTQQTILGKAGDIELTRTTGDAYVDFKSGSGEDYDCRIQQSSNGLVFRTGGEGSTALALTIDSAQKLTLPGALEVSGAVTFNGGTTSTSNLGIDGTWDIAGGQVTSTAAELNKLDGVTSTTAELNILDGVTADYTELNIMDGVTVTTANINDLVTKSDAQTISGGKTFSSDIIISDSGGSNIKRDDTDDYLEICSGTDSTNGAYLRLFGETESGSPGEVYINSDDGASNGEISLQVTASDKLVIDANHSNFSTTIKRSGITVHNFVDNSSGYPSVSDTSFDIATSIGASWETVGPTGAGATNTWTALDESGLVGCDWIELRIINEFTKTSPVVGTQYGHYVYAIANGGTETVNYSTIISKVLMRGVTTNTMELDNVTTHKVPVDSDGVFKLYATNLNSVTAVCSCYLIGYGQNGTG